MTGKKLRTLRAFRLALSILAVLLLCLAVVSGILSFSGGKPYVTPTEPAEQTTPDLPPLPSDEPEAATEAPDPGAGLSEAAGENTPAGGHSRGDGEAPRNPTTAPTEAAAAPTETTAVPTETTAAPTETPAAPTETTAAPAAAESEDLFATSCTDISAAATSPAEMPEAAAASEPAAAASEPAAETTEPPRETVPAASPLWKLLFRLSICLLIADLAAIGIVSLRIRDLENRKKPEPRPAVKPGLGQLTVGTIHCQGRRQYQQDSLGHSIVLDGCGVLAVVADGMGGLRDGDKVSQQVVLRTLELGNALRPGQENGALLQILKTVNEDVNRFLTPDGLYKSGSTVVAVLVSGEYFHWISVGDSRIYLYREGYVNQLNRDHDLLQDWMPEILDGRRSLEASRKDPAARKLTSFIGMGQLKYIDRSLHAIKVMPGDRILLMSDGVYGQLPDEQMAEILRRFPDVRQAAAEMDRCVRATQNPHQDNYTALILGF